MKTTIKTLLLGIGFAAAADGNPAAAAADPLKYSRDPKFPCGINFG